MKDKKKVHELLIELKRSESQQDFRLLYDLLYDRFFRIANYYLKKEEWTREVVMDVFLTLWNRRTDLITIGDFDNYCFILLKNASLNYLEKHELEFIPLDDKTKPEDSQTPEDNLLNEELLLVYIDALEELPPKCREVFVLVREQGLSYKEVAHQLDISVKTVDSQLQKAIKSIKEKIKLYFL
ncbi:MAG: RNA polymerase sigma-70 factor [Prevotella sp.]|jgi:RNA polymerase sigma-70 factor (ECF subfamily)|nr:RNA polymerase sigma-70 factor [Prevotella sp.]